MREPSGPFSLIPVFFCRTGELPWRDNLPNESCIPAGTYSCTWRESVRHGFCYHVEGVPGRSSVEIHSANFMGDSSKGLKCELLGCIAPGMQGGYMAGQKAVILSREALSKLENDLHWEDFELTIQDPS